MARFTFSRGPCDVSRGFGLPSNFFAHCCLSTIRGTRREAVVRWYSETDMPRARGVAQAAELQKKLNGIVPQPSAGVVKWRHTFGNDWTGDPAIFFWVTLTDEASKKDNLPKATEAFRKVLDERIDFQNDWDLIPYFNFRSESEQAILNDEVYA